MPLLVLADIHDVLAVGGQIAAIVIGLYSLLFILLTVVYGLTMDVLFTWLSDKVKVIKMLRPTVESVNKTSEAMVNGRPIPANENRIVEVVAQGPAQVQKLDQRVDQVTDRVANAVIEFRARTIQVQTVAKAFLTPNVLRRELAEHDGGQRNDDLEIKSPGLHMLMDEKVPDAPVVPAARPGDPVSKTGVTVSELKSDATTR